LRRLSSCNHRIKRNYPFGINSKAVMICKRCGKIITYKDLESERKQREFLSRRRY